MSTTLVGVVIATSSCLNDTPECGQGDASCAAGPGDDADKADAITASSIPMYGELGALPGSMDGAAMIASNNPESVSREGLLMSTMQLVASGAAVQRTLSSTELDPSCPAGSLRQFTFYMHHINGLGANARYYVLVEPVGSPSATFDAHGAAVTQLDTRSLDPGRSPSYAVSYAALAGALPAKVTTTGGSRFIRATAQTISGPHALVNVAANEGSSIDARVVVRATEGCLAVRVVAASAQNGSVALADALGKRAFAWGNVPTTAATPGGAPCTDGASLGWGRPAGTYQYDRWRGSFGTIALTSAQAVRGWKLLAAPVNSENNGVCEPATTDVSPSSNAQRAPALGYYETNSSGQTEGRDSDPFSTGNYGAEYTLAMTARNDTAGCVVAKLAMSSYPGARRCSDLPIGSSKSRHYDGAVRVTEDGTMQSPLRVFTKCPDGATSATLATKQLQPGQSVSWDVQLVVPGLISIPQGLLLASCPCGKSC